MARTGEREEEGQVREEEGPCRQERERVASLPFGAAPRTARGQPRLGGARAQMMGRGRADLIGRLGGTEGCDRRDRGGGRVAFSPSRGLPKTHRRRSLDSLFPHQLTIRRVLRFRHAQPSGAAGAPGPSNALFGGPGRGLWSALLGSLGGRKGRSRGRGREEGWPGLNATERRHDGGGNLMPCLVVGARAGCVVDA